ncbi:unnamed protein product [Rotaria magnacalcarata]|uniref:F-box domain-containing protein n=3 Tax=Rotaria magnacalcarata TaxID=392030 RepID=A0A820BB04_9BILA|nr:unnamed protein product [Rotaria magnacalcarata]
MICTFETLPNEVLIIIFSYLSWLEMLTLWPLNHRISNLICSIISINDNRQNSGIVIKDSGLSYDKYYLRLLPFLNHSSLLSFCSCIRRMCSDGTNSIACNISYEWIFFQNNDKKMLRFPFLKSLVLTRCWLSGPLIQNLSSLIYNQLDELILTFDKDTFNALRYELPSVNRKYNKKKLLDMFKHFLCQLFSSQCQLNSLRLDIGSYDIDQCIKIFSDSYYNPILNQFQSSCMTLSRLYIRIKCTYFLEHLIEHIPALERLSVEFNKTLNIQPRSVSLIEKLCQSNGNWYNKVPNLRYFALKSFILNDLEFVYLKWLLNNLNHVQKLKLRLGNEKRYRTDQIIWKSFIDANFVQQYCLPDIIDNIINFDFYISSPCQLLPIDAEKVVSSFQYHPLFINRQWTNIKYFYDPIRSYQHLFSTNINITLQSFNGLVNDPYVFQWPNIQHISIDFHPSLYIFLEQLDEKFPSVSSITVYMGKYLLL